MIARQAERERKIDIRPKWREDCGWGRPGSEYDGVHFKTFIGMSLRILHFHALKRFPDLKLETTPKTVGDIRDIDFSVSYLACNVEDYLSRLRSALRGELDEALCVQYLAFHKNARTPHKQCTEREFRSFLGVFQEILRHVER